MYRHVPALEVKEKKELVRGKFFLYVMVDHKILTYLKNKKIANLIVNKKFKIFKF